MHIRYPVTPSATYRLRSSLRFLATLFALSLLPAATVQSAVIITGELPPYSSAMLANGGELASKVLTTLKAAGHPDLRVSYQPWPRGLKKHRAGQRYRRLPLYLDQRAQQHPVVQYPHRL